MHRPDSKEPPPKSEREDAAVSTTEPDVPEEPEPEPWTPERAQEWNAYYDIYVILGVLLLVFIASANRITNSGIWSRLQVGRQIAAKAGPITTDPFSFTEAGKPWVNVPWLFDWAHAGVFKVASDLSPSDPSDPAGSAAKADQFGAGALVAMDALFRLATALFVLRIRRKGPGSWWSAVCVALALGAVLSPAGVVIGGVAGPGVVAPATWGLLLFAIELWLIHKSTVMGGRNAVFALVPLFALWANVDESFLIGLLVLGAATIGEAFAPAVRPEDDVRRLGLPSALIAFGLSALACLANPSIHGAFVAGVEPFLSLLHPSTDAVTIDQLSFFGSRLQAQAGAGARSLQAYYLILVAVGVGSFLLNRRRFSLGRFLVFALTAVLWGVFLRYGPEFALVFAAVLSLNGQEWYQDQFGTRGRVGWNWSMWSVGGRAVTIVLVFACVAKALTGFNTLFGDTRFGFGFDTGDFAFEAADFLKSAKITGNVLNTTVAQGDAIVWRAYPVRKSFIDNRQNLFPQELRNKLQQIREALREDDKDAWKPLLDGFDVSTVMIEPEGAPNTVRALSQSPNWIPYYDDGDVMLFGRTDAPEADVAFFVGNRLDPDSRAYKVVKPTPAADRPPTPITWMDDVFQWRTFERPQPHTQSARRWLASPDATQTVVNVPDPARCLLAIREARTALASKPDDTQAFRILVTAYRFLMSDETALLAGLKLTPENAAQIAQLSPNPGLLPIRYRQRVTALTYALQTTPKAKTQQERRELQALNMELFQLYSSVNSIDVARDRLQAAFDLLGAGDATPEQKTEVSQQLAQLDERIKQVLEARDQMAVEQQPNPVALANFLASQGLPGEAIHELEEADRTGANPALVKPRLVDLYCETGQPEKAIEQFSTGTINDPTFGSEPGQAALRQARAYALLGNTEYAATLIEKYASPALRYDRGARSMATAAGLLRGEIKGSTATLLDLPEKIRAQSQWEFEAGLYRLESGTPADASDHFTKSLTLWPTVPLRPIAAYYLEKLGKPVPPPPEAPSAREPADSVKKGDDAKKPDEKSDAAEKPKETSGDATKK
jgi:tetratricopeptide (TPR) repeat protein